MFRKILLLSGIVAMLWYAAVNIIVPAHYPGYDIASFTISELSAIGAPTRKLWISLCLFYSLLFIAFGMGVWYAAKGNRKLQVASVVIILDVIVGSFWPPMHKREVIAAGGGTLTDTLHIVWAFLHLVLMLLMIFFGAASFGKSFRIFSAVIVMVFLLFGILTTKESFGMDDGLPTPHIGIWERINIAAYMVWVIVFAILLMRKQQRGI